MPKYKIVTPKGGDRTTFWDAFRTQFASLLGYR